MDAILKLKPQQFKSIEGVFPDVLEKSKAKKAITSILTANEIVGAMISEDGDIEEGQTKIKLTTAHAVILYVDEEYFKIVESGKSEDGEDEELFYHLVDTIELNGWTLGKSFKKLNGIRVDSDEIIAIRTKDFEQLPMNADNYIEANLTWIFDQLLEDFEEKYGEGDDQEEIDDGD